MTLAPLHDRVVLTRQAEAETTPSGLFLATKSREMSNLATVVAVGPGRFQDDGTLVPTVVKPGQTVLVGKWGGDLVQIEGVDHLIVREADILAVVD